MFLSLSTALGLAAWFFPEKAAWWLVAVASLLSVRVLLYQWSEPERLRNARWVLGDKVNDGSDPYEPSFNDTEVKPETWQAISRALASMRAVSEQTHTLQALVTSLNGAIGLLSDRIVALQHQLDLERYVAKRSSLISFWGGVALSIPIGVAINLATN